MLKIWLTGLQPGLGVLGMALVLSSPLCSASTAEPKPTGVGSNNKTPIQYPKQWPVANSTGTNINKELQSSGIPNTPDFAVRQLAIDAMKTSVASPASVAVTLDRKNRDTLASFLTPNRFQNFSAKVSTPKFVKNSAASIVARKTTPKTTNVAMAGIVMPKATMPLVPGLFIGNSNVNVANKFLPTIQPLAQAMPSGNEIGAPTPLSAMMLPSKVASPFPVVRPEMMQAMKVNPTVASISAVQKAPRSLDPIAVIPPELTQQKAKTIGLASTLPSAPAKLPQNAPHSLDPIAAIPSGLQRLLGNSPIDAPQVASTPVAKIAEPKTDSLLALKNWISPTATVPSVTAASLQLATAQAYATASSPKFNIPGETISATKLAAPAINAVAFKHERKDLTTATVHGNQSERKSGYVAVMGDRRIGTQARHSWTVGDRRSHLGGLILGSQTFVSTQRIGLLPTSVVKQTVTSGLPAVNLSRFN